MMIKEKNIKCSLFSPRSDLLRFPPNEAKLSHRPFNLAYGHGHEHFVLATETQNV
jgi:hypothetical protein